MLRYILAAGVAALAFATPASAQQFTASSDICSDTYCINTSYTGPGSAGAMPGIVSDGGFDAFDGYGYIFDLGGLTLSRQTELLAGTNTYRFFDTFTNTTGATISQTVRFYGNLGSDGRENIQFSNSGAIVSCDSATCETGSDPALALVFNNNGFGTGAITPNDFNARYNLFVGAGQSVSLLNFAFLARDLSNRSGDRALAISTAQALQANPNVAGLTAEQQARVLNFNLTAAVPEPGTWAMMILGFGAVGGTMRRRQGQGLRLRAA